MRFPAAILLACAALMGGFSLPAHAFDLFPRMGGGSLASVAKRYEGMSAREIGLHRRTLWCGAFLAEATSLPVPKWNYHWADNWRLVGRKIAHPKPGAIALISYGRRGRGPVDHVGIVTGVDPTGQGFGGHFRAVQGFRYAEGM